MKLNKPLDKHTLSELKIAYCKTRIRLILEHYQSPQEKLGLEVLRDKLILEIRKLDKEYSIII